MTERHLSSIPITPDDLKSQLEEATNLLKSVSWSVEQQLNKADTAAYSRSLEKCEEVVSLSDLINAISEDDDLLSDVQLHALRAVRGAFQVARHVAEDYANRAGIPAKGGKPGITQIQITEFNEKKQTSSAIALFIISRYIIWNMQSLLSDNAFLESVNVSVDEVDISRLVPSLRCATFYLGKNIEKEVHGGDARLVAIVHKYAETLQKEILDRVGSLKHTGFFTDITYHLEDADFAVSGFELMTLSHGTVEIKETYPDQVIGSSTAGNEVDQSMRKLFLYDPKSQTNPIKEFGGFQSVQLLSGDPGNGKTLLLSVARTLGRDYAEASGLPYRDLVVPNMVSKMQGESTDLAREYLRQLLDPSTINLGIGDEFEVVIPDHGGDEVSEGDKKVAVEFLKGLSGVGSVDRMNFLFLAATNYPERLDKAFMSRVKSRHCITGAETIDDYMRFLILNLKKLNKLYPDLINIKGVEWDRDIREVRAEDDSYVRTDPTMTVSEIHEMVLKHHDPDDVRFFAAFFYLMKQRQKTFSLRDCANTVDGAKAHVAGFEIPLDWITEPNQYIEKELDHKNGLIAELATHHVDTSGINFAQMLDQKAVYYAEEALRMAETKRQREVEEYTERRLIQHLGEKEFNAKINGL